MAYRVFKRVWWKDATEPGWPDDLEPYAGPKHALRKVSTESEEREYVSTESEAREYVSNWNSNHKAGRYSLRAEYEEV